MENRLRVLCQERLHRGRIEVVLDLHHPDPSSWDVIVNEGLMEKILGAVERASRRLGREIQVTAESLLRIPQIMELRRKDFSAGRDRLPGTKLPADPGGRPQGPPGRKAARRPPSSRPTSSTSARPWPGWRS